MVFLFFLSALFWVFERMFINGWKNRRISLLSVINIFSNVGLIFIEGIFVPLPTVKLIIHESRSVVANRLRLLWFFDCFENGAYISFFFCLIFLLNLIHPIAIMLIWSRLIHHLFYKTIGLFQIFVKYRMFRFFIVQNFVNWLINLCYLLWQLLMLLLWEYHLFCLSLWLWGWRLFSSFSIP